jgi:hypothetical protein
MDFDANSLETFNLELVLIVHAEQFMFIFFVLRTNQRLYAMIHLR